jgi:hypothetical protein
MDWYGGTADVQPPVHRSGLFEPAKDDLPPEALAEAVGLQDGPVRLHADASVKARSRHPTKASSARRPQGPTVATVQLDPWASNTIGLAMRGVLLLLLTSAALSACESPGSEGGGYSVRDSVGIRIVESTGPAWEEGGGWTLSEDPLVQIGLREGREEYLFSRIVGGVLLPGGGIVVLDAQANLLRVYSAAGIFLAEGGGSGEGPGEMRRPQALALLPPDSVLVFDGGLLRASVFSSTAEFARSVSLQSPGPEPLARAHPLPNGTLIVETGWSSRMFGGDRTEGIHRFPAPIFRFSDTGELLDTVTVVPGPEVFLVTQGETFMMGAVPFGRSLTMAVWDSTLYLGTADEFEIRAHSTDGQLREVFRIPGVDLRLTREEIQKFLDANLRQAGTDQERQTMLVQLGNVPFPERKAAHAELKIDREGNLWLSEVQPRPLLAREWTVLSREGHFLGTVRIPDGFRVLDIGSERVLGVWTDDFDVPYVQVYGLRK